MGKIDDGRIIDFIRAVRAHFSLEQVILFGSRARGDHFTTSDYDILLVSNDFEGMLFSERVASVLDHWHWYPVEVDVICLTPGEFNKKKGQIGIIREAVREGIEIE
ncbi:MAG: nucleotidyltransferase domain-containing protein [Promethearchaeota archaeon]